MTAPIHVAITGAAGQIGYAMTFRIASGEVFGAHQPVVLHLIEVPPVMPALDGVHMELDDCAFPTLVAVPKLLRALADRAGAVQQTTAVAKQLLALASQHETASDPIEEFKTELLLKIADLPGQGGLGSVQTRRRLGDGAQFCNGDEGSRVPKIHTSGHA